MPRFYSVQETSRILGFSTNSIYKFLDQKRLKSTRGNSKQGRFRIPHSSIEEFLGAKLSENAIATSLMALRAEEQQAAATPLVVPGVKKSDSARIVERLGPSHPLVAPPEPVTPAIREKPVLSLSVIRFLILTALILLCIEVLTSPSPSIFQEGFYLVNLFIIILLAYQFGGVRREQ